MKLVVINDTHIADIWDKADKIIPAKHNFLNPNDMLRKTLRKIDSNSTLVFNGDLVDYHFADYDGKGKTNWELFFELLDEYKGKKIFNIGNHDYRKLPYNFDIYGMDHVNIDSETYRNFRKDIGFCEFRGLKELDSIGYNRRKFNPIPPSLTQKPQSLLIDGKKMIILDTRNDSLILPPLFSHTRNWPYLFTKHPSSLGISKTQLLFLEEELGSGPANEDLYIFMHCPIFFSEFPIPCLEVTKSNYQTIMLKQKLNHSTFLRNNWNVLEKLIHSDKNILVVTAHSHLSGEYIINKENRELHQATIGEINYLRNDSNYIKFITNLPLGAIRHPEKKVGYLVINDDEIRYEIVKDYS